MSNPAPTKPPTREQVQAWLYMVLSPLVTRLGRERYYLGLRHPTWNFLAGRCESLRPLTEYIDQAQEPTLHQLLRYYPHLKKAVDTYDQVLMGLEAAATRLQQTLPRVPSFLQLLHQIETTHPAWRADSDRPGENMGLLVETLINWSHLPETPSSDTRSAAWSAYRTAALKLREDPAAKPLFDTLDLSLGRLTECTNDLHRQFSELRDDLADQFGLPPAAPTRVQDLFGSDG
jgi:hypothetical protein